MVKRLRRNKLTPPSNAGTVQHPGGSVSRLIVDQTSPINIAWVEELQAGVEIARELGIFLRGQRAKRLVANNCLRYLRYVKNNNGSIDKASLLGFRQQLDIDESICTNTKSELLGTASRFVRHLMASQVVPTFDPIENFKLERRRHISTFVDLCRYEIRDLLKDHREEVSHAQTELKLEKRDAEAVVFSKTCMSKIAANAEKEVLQHIDDWGYIDRVLGDLGSSSSAAASWPLGCVANAKVEAAICQLHEAFGRLLPALSQAR